MMDISEKTSQIIYWALVIALLLASVVFSYDWLTTQPSGQFSVSCHEADGSACSKP
jgi:hypothetical protein